TNALSLHDALPISPQTVACVSQTGACVEQTIVCFGIYIAASSEAIVGLTQAMLNITHRVSNSVRSILWKTPSPVPVVDPSRWLTRHAQFLSQMAVGPAIFHALDPLQIGRA